MTINSQQLQTLVNQWCPIVYLSANERYNPCTVDFYLENAALCDSGGNVIVNAPVAEGNLPQAVSTDYLLPNSTAMAGESTAPFYVRATIPADNANAIDIEYWFFYGFNGNATFRADIEIGSIKHNLLVPIPPFGDHQGDWEHAIVRLDDNFSFIGLYTAEHGWGTWNAAGSFQTGSDGRPIIYSAVNSHASYVGTGVFTIKDPISIGFTGLKFQMGLADQTDKGTLWDCLANGCGAQIVSVTLPGVPDPAAEWTCFTGHFGSPTDQTSQINAATHIIWEAIKDLTMHLADPYKSKIEDTIKSILSDSASTMLPGGPASPNMQKDWTSGAPGQP